MISVELSFERSGTQQCNRCYVLSWKDGRDCVLLAPAFQVYSVVDALLSSFYLLSLGPVLETR